MKNPRGNDSPLTTPQRLGSLIKSARDIMRKDKGLNGDLDRPPVRIGLPVGIIQGGDPLTKDATKTSLFGTGGMNQLKPEFTDDDYARGAVAAVLAPNLPDSGGTQFFVAISDQPTLDGKYTVFARVVDGKDARLGGCGRHQGWNNPRVAARRATSSVLRSRIRVSSARMAAMARKVTLQLVRANNHSSRPPPRTMPKR